MLQGPVRELVRRGMERAAVVDEFRCREQMSRFGHDIHLSAYGIASAEAIRSIEDCILRRGGRQIENEMETPVLVSSAGPAPYNNLANTVSW